MKSVIQRVNKASVSVNNEVKGSIDKGLVILLGIGRDDTDEHAALLAERIRLLRIFEDENGKFNYSLEDVQGAALVISQFTLYADTRKGRRPSFTDAAPYDAARELYQCFVDHLRKKGIPTETGEFGERMVVTICNDGPVTITLEA